MRSDLSVQKIASVLAALGTSAVISACGGGDAKPEANSPVNANEVTPTAATPTQDKVAPASSTVAQKPVESSKPAASAKPVESSPPVRTGGCTSDTECGGGQVCETCATGKCCTPGCHTDAQCGGGQRCQKVQCIRAPCPGQCGAR